MKRAAHGCLTLCLTAVLALAGSLPEGQAPVAKAESEWEITPQSEEALQRGIEWLTRNQGPEGNWTSNDLGLVSMGALAYLSAGHSPGRGRHGEAAARAIDYVTRNTKPSGLLNIADERRGMYNHGLSAFVLGQAYGMSNDERIGPLMDRALKLIAQTQCDDGGWDYVAKPQQRGHDLSLAVMQAKALRSAVDSGLEVPPEVIELAIRSVREHYTPNGCSHTADEAEQQRHPGQFTYTKGGGGPSVAMAAAGVVCLQEFAQYDDWRIEKNMEVIGKEIREKTRGRSSNAPFDAYTLYYLGQALYQVGGKHWREHYPPLRDALIACQVQSDDPSEDGKWRAHGRVGGKPGDLYMTGAACFILAMPNRYLPILQEGKIDSLQQRFQQK
ncbi:MAG: squalene--hopene cyclase [Pirellulales bacterium]|nr:squalene--hopene cyclase [Pirellulales bacterium]